MFSVITKSTNIFIASLELILLIYIPGRPAIFYNIIVQIMMSANIRIHLGLQIVFVCLYITPSHYHHCANLSKDIVECMSKIKHVFSVIHGAMYGAVCFQFTHFPCDD